MSCETDRGQVGAPRLLAKRVIGLTRDRVEAPVGCIECDRLARVTERFGGITDEERVLDATTRLSYIVYPPILRMSPYYDSGQARDRVLAATIETNGDVAHWRWWVAKRGRRFRAETMIRRARISFANEVGASAFRER